MPFSRLHSALYCLSLLKTPALAGGSSYRDRLFVHFLELEQVLVAGLGVLLAGLEEPVGPVGELAGQSAVPGLVHEEVAVAAGRLLAVERKLGLSRRVEGEWGVGFPNNIC